MIVSWKWISQWVDTSGIDPVAFARRFTCTVAEIDGVHQWGFGLDGVVVADVLSVVPHPNADKLRLATVDLGSRQVTVVCGAPDLRVGMRVPFVPPGVTLPSGIAVRDGEVRGVKSPGMLASEADLGLSDDHGGLLSLDGVKAPAGTALSDAIALQDVLYEVDNKSITHRPDLWGQYGMAREVAAMLQRDLKPLDLQVHLGQGAAADVRVETPLCPRYCCARIAGVAVAPSAVDYRLLLRRLGVRPISNVVDATNLVMLETGNPLHAFDARYLRGNQIRVRAARQGEVVQTLDGSERTLSATDLVIADGDGPVALAGVMGGGNSEIRADTQEVVLEAAAFDAATVRKTAMRVGLRTESSARFEKALDPAMASVAALRFLKLIGELSPGAQVTSGLLDVGDFATQPKSVPVIATHVDYLRSRLGVSVAEMDDAWIDNCLRRLEFTVERKPDGALRVGIPSFRATRDIRHAEDLVEELGRHFGYHRIASQAPLIPSRPPWTPPHRLAERKVRAALTLQQGMTETLLYGFDHETARARLSLSEGSSPRLPLRNAISSDHLYLRRNLAPNLVAAIEQNLLRGDGREAPKEGLVVALFEVGRVFVPVPQRKLSAAEQAALDPGLPALALAAADNPDRQAWFGRMDAEMAGAIDKALAAAQTLPLQPVRLGIAVGERLGGGAEGSKRAVPARSVSQRVFAEAVAALQSVARALGKGELCVERLQAPPELEALPAAAPDAEVSWLHPARHGWVRGPRGELLGLVTLIHPQVRHAFDVPAEVAVAEVDLEALLALADQPVVGLGPARHPGAHVDLTLGIPHAMRQASLCRHLQQTLAERALPVADVRYLYEFTSPSGERNVTLRLGCRAAERTLSAKELEEVLNTAQESSRAWVSQWTAQS